MVTYVNDAYALYHYRSALGCFMLSWIPTSGFLCIMLYVVAKKKRMKEHLAKMQVKLVIRGKMSVSRKLFLKFSFCRALLRTKVLQPTPCWRPMVMPIKEISWYFLVSKLQEIRLLMIWLFRVNSSRSTLALVASWLQLI